MSGHFTDTHNNIEIKITTDLNEVSANKIKIYKIIPRP